MELNELVDMVDAKLTELNENNDTYITHFKPQTGVVTYEETDYDDNGERYIKIKKHNLTEDEAFEEAKRAFLDNKEWWSDFINSEFYNEVAELLADKLKEKYGWK